MRIAIPTSGGLLEQHFGHCEQMTFVDVDSVTKAVTGSREEATPAHEPGLLPRWVRERGADVVIAGGMGARARALLEKASIKVVTGAESRPPESIVHDYLAETLTTVANSCHHRPGESHEHHKC